MVRDLLAILFDDTLSPTRGLSFPGALAIERPHVVDGGSSVNNPGTLLKLFAAAAVVMVLLLATATWFFFKRPLTLDAAVSRFALGQAGLMKRQVKTPSGNLTVFEGGQGSTLILVHDAGEQAGSWARVVTPLVERYRVVIPDISGHGSSDPRNGPIVFGHVVSDLAAMVEDCCHNEVLTLVGHGFGARVIWQFAADYPEHVGHVILVNGGPLEPDTTGVNLFPSNREETLRTMQGLMGTEASAIPGHVLDDIARHANNGPASRIEAPPPLPLEDKLRDARHAVSLVWGARDMLYDLEYASEVSRLLNNAPVKTLDQCGHMPQRECPVEFAEALQTTIGTRVSAERPGFQD